MKRLSYLKSAALGGASVLALATGAFADEFAIPSGDLASALDSYTRQTGVALLISGDALTGTHTNGARGTLTASEALTRLLKGTGFAMQRDQSGAVAIVPLKAAHIEALQPQRLAQAAPHAPAAAGIESVVVTSSKIKGDIQTVPIAITALSQEQLTARQIAGGPDLVKEVPNLTFSKTNFSGYNIQIRGIGTQAISVTTDPAVAVAFNDTPFIRSHFFEQEFFDVSQVEVLRGPQGTLFGRNATAGVVNVVSAKPSDHFEAMLSADWGNYSNRRYEGMVNIPVVGDKLMLRAAGEWTKRDGYSFNETTGKQIDGRDLWSSRLSLRWQPDPSVRADFVWEHFHEGDDRLRSGKQLCHTDPEPASFTAANGTVVNVTSGAASSNIFAVTGAYFSQGCMAGSLYDKGNPALGNYGAFGVPDGFSLPFIQGAKEEGLIAPHIDPYASTHQSTDLRNIQSALDPTYKANSDTLELNTEWNVTPNLTFNSETGYNNDFLWSTQDLNRFDTSPCIFNTYDGYPHINRNEFTPDPQCPVTGSANSTQQGGIFCDPQLGCSNRLVLQDLSEERSWQFSQEVRLASDFEGPFNFSAGGNYMHYETAENFYVFSNTFTMISMNQFGCGADWVPNVTNNLYCLFNSRSYGFNDPALHGGGVPTESPQYIDPNPITNLDNKGHNYFLSQNPYVLNSYALFGEVYYNITKDIKLTGGLRWTDDQKHFTELPSEVLAAGYGYPSTGQVDDSWKKYTGRAVINWQPQLSFTDQTMVYASFAHGYKAGGQNPPPAVLLNANSGTGNINFPVHPLDFKPEYVNAFELGTKNTALDGGLTFDADAFYYDYTGYQISQLVDRTSVNLNFDANIWGAEIQTTWSPLPGVKLGFNGGYENTRVKDDQYAIDLIDRTAGVPGWTVMKPSVGQASNCIIPDYVAAALVQEWGNASGQGYNGVGACGAAYVSQQDPLTQASYVHNPSGVPAGYPGYDPLSVDSSALAGVNNGLGLPPNNGEGFAKPLGGNELPNAPHFTVSLTGDYTMPVSTNWAATLHTDFYWQSQSFARIFNDRPYDKIRGYSNVNLALILTDASGWQVMGYVKNVFDKTAITGDFLYTDDVGLTTNVFLTDPRLFGVRVTRNFDGGSDGFDLFSNADGKPPQVWLTLGGNYNATVQASTDPYAPLAFANFPNGGSPTPNWNANLLRPEQLQESPHAGFDWEGALTFRPADSDWILKAGIRYGRSGHNKSLHKSVDAGTRAKVGFPGRYFYCSTAPTPATATPYQITSGKCYHGGVKDFVDSQNASSERHTILDFMLGRDVGIGVFGQQGTGTFSGGVRLAQFDSKSGLNLGAGPDYNLPENIFVGKYHDTYEFYTNEKRSFHGIGPEVAWDASQPVWGDAESGQVAVDWGLNAGLMFGKQSARLHHTVHYCRHSGFGTLVACDGYSYSENSEPPDDVVRSRSVTVPNLGGYAGLSVRYSNAKISFGYRADEFFGAMDGGEATAKKYNRGFMGPFLNLSLGFGG